MFIKLHSAAPLGFDFIPIEVEVDINKGQTAFNIVGLPDVSIKEAKSRVYSAIKNSGFVYPFNFRILINLAPADLHKEGPSFDLPMAVGIIALSKDNFLNDNLRDSLFAGELALDGSLRHTNGILPITLFAKQQGLKQIFVPKVNTGEAGLVKNITIYPVENLKQLIDHLSNNILIKEHVAQDQPPRTKKTFDANSRLDMSMVNGQQFAKRALEIAASGAHNVLLTGPPGSGKTLLSRTLPSILPELTTDECLEVTKIYSLAGLLKENFISRRPFRAPHHTASPTSLVGGGKYPRPGEISLAHRGVLFLDELPEFARCALENLRQPLEDGVITISRAKACLTYPARFILIASQNPCPCGYSADPEHPCTCNAQQIISYRKKISGPLLDRIDLYVEVPRLKFNELVSQTRSETSAQIRKRVQAARQIQQERFKNLSIQAIQNNSEMTNLGIKKYCQIDSTTENLLRCAVNEMHLSARAYNRILKVSRTIADLDQSTKIKLSHVAEALQYRSKAGGF